MAIRKWSELMTGRGREIALAVDTEFEGTETLTVQFAASFGEEVRVQVYHAEGIPLPKAVWFKSLSEALSTEYGRTVVVRPAKPITPGLSLARVLADIWNLPQPETCLERKVGECAEPAKAGECRAIAQSCSARELLQGAGQASRSRSLFRKAKSSSSSAQPWT